MYFDVLARLDGDKIVPERVVKVNPVIMPIRGKNWRDVSKNVFEKLEGKVEMIFTSYCFNLLGVYLLLLALQMLTEMLTWHWESPLWFITLVVCETYRVLQLIRGLKLGAELGAPTWTVHTIRGMVCWWVLVLGVQVMRVAWYAGFTAHPHQNKSPNASEVKTSAG
nr:cytochrome P450 [Tanacetum cinerariifolium]